MNEGKRLGIIGGGRAAWALGSAWLRAGGDIEGVHLRPGSGSNVPDLLDAPRLPIDVLASRSESILLAVPDGAIPPIARQLGRITPPATWLIHASGSLPSSAFGDRERRLALHPLRALPLAPTSTDFSRVLFIAEGPEPAITFARVLVTALGATLLTIGPEEKPRYHAAAVIASNLMAALLEIATETMAKSGLPERSVRPAIAELARSAIDGWSGGEGGRRFTGPVARADQGTIESHLLALASEPDHAELYRRLSIEVAKACRGEGRDEAEVSRIIEFLRAWTLS